MFSNHLVDKRLIDIFNCIVFNEKSDKLVFPKYPGDTEKGPALFFSAPNAMGQFGEDPLLTRTSPVEWAGDVVLD
jgi:hypothetical protein